MNEADFQIKKVGWQDEEAALRKIRTIVFIDEQNVPEELEWDNEDKHCLHVLVEDISGMPVATARILDNGQIGRMAVLKDYRQKGIGKLMLHQLLLAAQEKGLTSVFLNAQIDAVSFYQSFGFKQTGSRFNDAGIQHIRMIKSL